MLEGKKSREGKVLRRRKLERKHEKGGGSKV